MGMISLLVANEKADFLVSFDFHCCLVSWQWVLILVG